MYNDLKNFFLTILIFIKPFIIAFGFWFLLFWFFTGNFDLFTWSVSIKIVYTFFSIFSFAGILTTED